MQNNSLSANEGLERTIQREVVLCPNCGKTLRVNDIYCEKCGRRLNSENFFSIQFFKNYSHLFIVTFLSIAIYEVLSAVTNFVISPLYSYNQNSLYNLLINLLSDIPFLIMLIFLYIYLMKSKFSIPRFLFKKILIYEFWIIIFSTFLTNTLGSFFSNYFFSEVNISTLFFTYWIYGFGFTIIFAFLLELRLDYAK